jgi:hypothetical protein
MSRRMIAWFVSCRDYVRLSSADGEVDTDGSIGETGAMEFTSVSTRLVTFHVELSKLGHSTHRAG